MILRAGMLPRLGSSAGFSNWSGAKSPQSQDRVPGFCKVNNEPELGLEGLVDCGEQSGHGGMRNSPRGDRLGGANVVKFPDARSKRIHPRSLCHGYSNLVNFF